MSTHIFCTGKLQKFLGFKEDSSALYTPHPLHSWNAQLFYLNKKKGLFFINNETLFCFVEYPVVKADTRDFDALFLEGLIRELYKVGIADPALEGRLRERFTSVALRPTNNNRKALGHINQRLREIDYYYYNYDTPEEYFQDRSLSNGIYIKKPEHPSEVWRPDKLMKERVEHLFWTVE